MFENLQERFDRAFKVLKGHGSITEVNVGDTLKEVQSPSGRGRRLQDRQELHQNGERRALGRQVLTAIQPGYS